MLKVDINVLGSLVTEMLSSEGFSDCSGRAGTGIGGFFWLSWKICHWAGVSVTVRLPSGLGLGFGVGLIPSNPLFWMMIIQRLAGICRINLPPLGKFQNYNVIA